MANKNGTTRTRMDLSRLNECIEALHAYAGDDTEEEAGCLPHATAEQAAVYLEHFAEKEANNKLYHKRQNMKQREFVRLAKQMMSRDEQESVERAVNKQLGDVTIEDLQEGE